MQAVKQHGYGGREQLSIGETARPTPKAGCVLVCVHAVSVHAGDHHVLTGRPYMMRLAVGHKEIPGMDFSGTVEVLGPGVTGFALGDHVFGTKDVACGAFAEYVSVPTTNIVKKPDKVTWEEAAGLPTSGMTALQALRLGRAVKPGQRVLINGASSGVGTFAVQLAKSMGAHVTGVCSTQNVEMVRSLGADVVVDYRTESVEAAAKAAGVRYDKILDIVGRYGWRKLLTPNGSLVAVALPQSECHGECIPCVMCSIVCTPWCCCCLSSKKSLAFMQAVTAADMSELAGMVAEGKLRVVMGLQLSGIAAVPDALAGHSATTGQGHRKGKTVISFAVDVDRMKRD